MEPLTEKTKSDARVKRRLGAKLLTSAQTCKIAMRSSQNRPKAAASRSKNAALTLASSDLSFTGSTTVL